MHCWPSPTCPFLDFGWNQAQLSAALCAIGLKPLSDPKRAGTGAGVGDRSSRWRTYANGHFAMSQVVLGSDSSPMRQFDSG